MLAKSTTVMPLVSVIIPNYNNAKYLAAAIDSVLQQDYPNIEVILVDDGSTDNSLEILENYKDKIILVQQENQGAAAARNTGLRKASGDFIAFHDSDDLWLPGKLTKQVNFLINNHAFIACFTHWAVWDGEKPLPKSPSSNDNKTNLQTDRTGWLYLPLLKESVITTISIMIRAHIVRKVGFFNTNYQVGEDHDYWLRLSQFGQIAKLADTYAIYRVNFESTTKRVKNENFSLTVLKENVKEFGLCDPVGNCISQQQYRFYEAERHFTYGYQCFWSGEKLKARYSFLQCLKNKCFIYKALRYLLLSYIPFFYQSLIKKHAEEWSKRKL